MDARAFWLHSLWHAPEGRKVLYGVGILAVTVLMEALLLMRIVRKVRARTRLAAPEIPWTLSDLWSTTLVTLPLGALLMAFTVYHVVGLMRRGEGMEALGADPWTIRIFLAATLLVEGGAAWAVVQVGRARHGMSASELGFWFPGVAEGVLRPAAWIGGFLLFEAAYLRAAKMWAGGMRPPMLEGLIGSVKGSGDAAFVVASAAVIVPVLEELLFRGFLYPMLRRYVGTGWALAVTSFLFAVAHILEPEGGWRQACLLFPLYSLLGLLLGGLVQRTGSLLPSILAHSLNNLYGVAKLLGGGI